MSDKTMVDVADKAVDKLSGGIESIAQAVEKVAPHVWEILVRQALTEGIVMLVLGLALVVAAPVALVKTWRRTKEYDEARFFIGLPAAIALMAALILLPLGGLRVGNPEYYAAKELIDAAAGATR